MTSNRILKRPSNAFLCIALWVGALVNGLSLITACAGRYESDKHDANYYKGRYFQAPQPAEPSAAPGNQYQFASGPSNAGDAVAGLMLSGITLAANPDYYRSVAITGHCDYRGSPQANIALPCVHVDIVLTDPHGNELARTQPTNGEFAFRVQKGRPFRLTVVSPKFRLANPVKQDLFLGDDIVLHLVRK